MRRGGRPREQRPFPLAPLLAQCDGEISVLALRLGLTKRSIHRLVNLGLSEVKADRFAVAAGLHPAEVWGDLWWSTAPGEEALTAVAG